MNILAEPAIMLCFGLMIGIVLGAVVATIYPGKSFRSIWIEIEPEYEAVVYDLLKFVPDLSIFRLPSHLDLVDPERKKLEYVDDRVYFRIRLRRWFDREYREVSQYKDFLVHKIESADLIVRSAKIC